MARACVPRESLTGTRTISVTATLPFRSAAALVTQVAAQLGLEEVAHAKRSGSRPQPVAHQRPHTERSQALTLPLCQATPFHHTHPPLASRLGSARRSTTILPPTKGIHRLYLRTPEAPYGSKCDHVPVASNP